MPPLLVRFEQGRPPGFPAARHPHRRDRARAQPQAEQTSPDHPLAEGLVASPNAARAHRSGVATTSVACRMTLLREMIGTFCTDPAEVEARSLLAFCLAIGEHFLAAEHGAHTRAQILSRAADLIFS